LGAFVSAFAVPITSDPKSVFVFLSISRLVLGVGVGGVYPLAATIAAESSDAGNRGRNASLVFSMQGIGTLAVPIIGMIFLYGLGTYEDRLDNGDNLPGIAWRLILGVGALPGILLIPFKAKDASRPAVTKETQPRVA
jgi:PHS family inorganic phosphate transporter-like MFS transporter